MQYLPLYSPLAINNDFDSLYHGEFSDYLQKCQNIIAQSRQKANFYADPQFIQQVCPFEFGSGNCGILMLHGLLETPFITRDIANYFKQKNYLLRSILLPGHGTIPGDLINIQAEEWKKACNYGIKTMVNDQNIDGFYIIGISTGAALALLASYQAPIPKLKGIILFSPAIYIPHYHAWYFKLSQFIGNFWSRAKWIEKNQENDFSRYHSLCFNAAHQVFLLTQEINRNSQHKNITQPLFFILSEDDAIVSYKKSLHFFKQQKNPLSRMLIYSTKMKSDNDKRIDFANSYYPEENILHFSHISLYTSPDNPHYGRNGNYKFKIKKRSSSSVYGEVAHLLNVTHRLSYNPDFYALMASLEDFISTCNRNN